MRFDFRHLARATLLVAAALSFTAVSAHAQECQDCQTCQDGSCQDEGYEYADSTYGDGTVVPAGYRHRHRHVGGYRKACYGYRPYTEASQPDVFFNLYQPNNFGAAAAAYPAPYPTPNLIGHTYYTYQPLMPHEFLYKHRRTYHQYYNGGKGLNRTKVRWHGTPIRTSLKSVHKFISLPR